MSGQRIITILSQILNKILIERYKIWCVGQVERVISRNGNDDGSKARWVDLTTKTKTGEIRKAEK